MAVYALSGGAYLAFVVYGYRAATDRFLIARRGPSSPRCPPALLVAWITFVNLLYLLMQIAIAVDGGGVTEAPLAGRAFHPRRIPRTGGVFAVVLALVVAATLASALAWSGVGLIAFVPLVGLAVFPLQLAALLVRGLVFEYLGLTALDAYVTLYVDHAATAGPTHPSSSARNRLRPVWNARPRRDHRIAPRRRRERRRAADRAAA